MAGPLCPLLPCTAHCLIFSTSPTAFSREFKPGTVIKVEVKNFMTYAHAVIEPGPRLNLVLGPNGERRQPPCSAVHLGDS